VKICASVLGVWLVLALGVRADGPAAPPDVKLIVHVVIDGLRQDGLRQSLPRMDRGGFAALLNRGADFRTVHYKHATTFTAVGHATLFTGAYPSHHGIVGNYWYDPVRQEPVYAVGDTRYPLIFAGPGVAPQAVWRPVGPEDVAPTIAAYLGIAAPSGCVGSPLPEVLGP
jgi:predicted AlkP superfamily pyrophosphatase or phosphodiesterase